MLGWVAMILFPRKPWATRIVPVAIPALLSVVYAVLILMSLPGSEGGFSSLGGVRTLFADPWALLAGWTHYLAFDLFIGGWELRDAHQRDIPHLVMIPILLMTFMLGPAGLLLYLALRMVVGRKDAPAIA
jgi:hypothetical protein